MKQKNYHANDYSGLGSDDNFNSNPFGTVHEHKLFYYSYLFQRTTIILRRLPQPGVRQTTKHYHGIQKNNKHLLSWNRRKKSFNKKKESQPKEKLLLELLALQQVLIAVESNQIGLALSQSFIIILMMKSQWVQPELLLHALIFIGNYYLLHI